MDGLKPRVSRKCCCSRKVRFVAEGLSSEMEDCRYSSSFVFL